MALLVFAPSYFAIDDVRAPSVYLIYFSGQMPMGVDGVSTRRANTLRGATKNIGQKGITNA